LVHAGEQVATQDNKGAEKELTRNMGHDKTEQITTGKRTKLLDSLTKEKEEYSEETLGVICTSEQEKKDA
jgi:hypothetical protein